jgi:hypothetical protein
VSNESNVAKTILLKVDLKENDILKYDPIILFTPYKDWMAGVSKYQADFYYDSARAFYTISNNSPTDTSFFHKYVNLVQRDYCYKVTGYEKNNESVFSESNIACIETKPRLYAPNVFTINNDGLNDLIGLHMGSYNPWKGIINRFNLYFVIPILVCSSQRFTHAVTSGNIASAIAFNACDTPLP